MDAVKIFNGELCSLYELKPPITKAKMAQITKTAIKAIKFYKHIVQSVEKFIQKCRPEYKVPGLYIVDSIIRQSRKQFGPEKDMFAVRFSKNLVITFHNLFDCPQEDIAKMIRVLNLWQKNGVYGPEIIQPLLDLAGNPHSDSLFESVQQKVEKITGMVPSMPIKTDQKPPALTADALQLGFDATKSMDQTMSVVNNTDMTQILTQIMQTLTCQPPLLLANSAIGASPAQLQLMQQALLQSAAATSASQSNPLGTSIPNLMSLAPTFAGHNLSLGGLSAPFDASLLTQLQVITQQLLASSNSIVSKSTNQPSTASPIDTNEELDASTSEDRRVSSLDRRLDAIKAGRESDFCYDDYDEDEAHRATDDEANTLDADNKRDHSQKESSKDWRFNVKEDRTSDSPSKCLDSHHSHRNYSPARHENGRREASINQTPAYADASPISGESGLSGNEMSEHTDYEPEDGEVVEHMDNYRHGNENREDSHRGKNCNRKEVALSPEYFWAEKSVGRTEEGRKRKHSCGEMEWETYKTVSSRKTTNDFDNGSNKKSKVEIKNVSIHKEILPDKEKKSSNLKDARTGYSSSKRSRSPSYSNESTGDPMYDPFKCVKKPREIRSVVKKCESKPIVKSNDKDYRPEKYGSKSEKRVDKNISKLDNRVSSEDRVKTSESASSDKQSSRVKSAYTKADNGKSDKYKSNEEQSRAKDSRANEERSKAKDNKTVEVVKKGDAKSKEMPSNKVDRSRRKSLEKLKVSDELWNDVISKKEENNKYKNSEAKYLKGKERSRSRSKENLNVNQDQESKKKRKKKKVPTATLR